MNTICDVSSPSFDGVGVGRCSVCWLHFLLEITDFDFFLLPQRILVIPHEVQHDNEQQRDYGHDDSSSSSDDNDSTAAAHAAAIGHSPQPVRPILAVEGAVPTQGLQGVAATTNVTQEDSAKTQVTTSQREGNSSEPVDGVRQPLEAPTPTASNSSKTTAAQEPNSEPKSVEQAKNQSPIDPMNVDEEPKKIPNSNTTEGEEKKNGSTSDALKTDTVQGCPDDKGDSRTRRKSEVHYNTSININKRDEDENTPLHVAIHARKLEHVKLLLEAGASFRMRCDGSWPLHTAISMGAIKKHMQFAYECVVVLHEHEADLTVKDDSNHTPLFLSCMYNLPEIVSYILSDDEGLTTLNTRADRAGNRPLHAAAKYDTLMNPAMSKVAAAAASATAQTVTRSTEALLTQVLLGTPGIEVDALNVLGQTPLHVACIRGNWSVVRLLVQSGARLDVTDRRGFTPGQHAYKRGMPIPNDLLETLGPPPESGIIPPTRDLIVDPNGKTFVLTHELCVLHRSCPPIRRDSPEPPPENVRRLQVLIDEETGILKSGEFGRCQWKHEARRAAIADVLKVHHYSYVEKISEMTSLIHDHPNAIAHLDPDTAVSRWSFESAMRAAGSVCQAVDMVVGGDCRNAFCAVRPPGHHAGPRGIVHCPNDPEGGSHGFCLLNNVAIGAAYARSMYRNDGIQKVAIIDFDVHHGNGTEEIIKQLVPMTEKAAIRSPFVFGELSMKSYSPWLDETDVDNVFFASTHGYGNRGYSQPGWFYPASGKTQTSESISHPSMVEQPSLAEFLSSQTWARMGDESKFNCCKIIDIGLDLPDQGSDPQTRNIKQRLELRDTYRQQVLPQLREFDPDLIFISAGFDAHRRDTMNFGYVGMVEEDYEWLTEQLIKIANTCCNGRVISVLEGGYKIHGGIVSPFARSVASHVRALADGGGSRELYDTQDGVWESQFERHLFERRERKREQEREQLRLAQEENNRRNLLELAAQGDTPEDPDAPSRKRRRNEVDYKELFKQMQAFANG